MRGYYREFQLKCSTISLVVPELPQPNPGSIDWISPTLANDLIDCSYRVAWRTDSASRSLSRPSTFSELGIVAHGVMEDAGRALFMDSEDEMLERSTVEGSWTSHVERASHDLAKAWEPATPPVPEEWPGYHLTKARVIRRALRLRKVDGSSVDEHRAPVLVEQELRDDANRLRGRPDRVEGAKNARRIVDLKMGLNQADPTTAQLRQLMLYGHLVEVATGDRVSEIAVEDASGRRWTRPLDHDEVNALVGQVESTRNKYEAARVGGTLETLALPSNDGCRWCPFRVTCGPYWRALESTWSHGSVLGHIDKVSPGADGSNLEITADSPIDSTGPGWIVSLAPTETAVAGSQIAVAGAELTGAERHLRWRWSTTMSVIA